MTEKRSQVEILRKRFFWAPNGSRTHGLPEYRLDALTTELWETRGEQGHILWCVWHNQLIIYPHYLSFRHVEPCSMAGHASHTSEPSIWPCSPRVSHSSVVRASNRYSGRSWVRLPLGAQKNFFLSISTWERFSVIYNQRLPELLMDE